MKYDFEFILAATDPKTVGHNEMLHHLQRKLKLKPNSLSLSCIIFVQHFE